MRGRVGGHGFGCALRNDLAAAMAAFRTKIYHPVGGLDHIQIMFNHHHCIAVVAQAVQHIQQGFNVMKMQAGGGFVEDIQRAPGVAAAEFF